MATIEQILRDANDDSKPLDSVLRSAMVLAYRLDYEPLITWVNAELDGYPTNENLPDYRWFWSETRASFFNGYWRRPNELVPREAFPEEWRDAVSKVELLVGVRALEDTADLNAVVQNLPSFVVNYLTEQSAHGFACLGAWVVIPPGAVAQVLSSVRNRLLRFCLTLQREYPELSDDGNPGAEAAVPQPAVAYYFNTIVMGQNASVALGPNAFAEQLSHIQPHDFESLSESLSRLGIRHEEIEALRDLTDELTPEEVEGNPSAMDRIRDWSAKAVKGSIKGIPSDARGYVVGVLVKMIAQYYGVDLPS